MHPFFVATAPRSTSLRSRAALIALAVAFCASAVQAQTHEHRPGMVHPGSDASAKPAAVTSAGQGAFGAIAEIVRLLEADSTTDWSTVDIERLRRHLIDMDEVTLRSTVVSTPVDGGARFTITGSGRTIGAIRRMTAAHATMLSSSDAPYTASVTARADGAVMTVTVRKGTDGAARDVARLRGLGFIGLMTVGDHHGPHHLQLARGGTPTGHAH